MREPELIHRSSAARLAYTLASVSPDIVAAATEASAFLRERGVPHAMCGGLAVGAYGVGDFELDVEFIVGDEAFKNVDGLRVVRDGIPIAFGEVPISIVWLERRLHALRSAVCEPYMTDGVHVLAPEALIAMRLANPRMQHQADIVALLVSGCVDVDSCRSWLVARAFNVALFDRLLAKAKEG